MAADRRGCRSRKSRRSFPPGARRPIFRGKFFDREDQRGKARRAWTTPQREWLGKIAAQLEVETVMDREAFDEGLFKSNGGFARIDRSFDGKLAEVLDEVNDAIWQDVA